LCKGGSAAGGGGLFSTQNNSNLPPWGEMRGLTAGRLPNLSALSVETLCVSTYSHMERLKFVNSKEIPRRGTSRSVPAREAPPSISDKFQIKHTNFISAIAFNGKTW